MNSPLRGKSLGICHFEREKCVDLAPEAVFGGRL
jgi:hypothetical protein